jgi:hypothetical protein
MMSKVFYAPLRAPRAFTYGIYRDYQDENKFESIPAMTSSEYVRSERVE